MQPWAESYLFQGVLAGWEDVCLGAPHHQGAHQEGCQGPSPGREVDPQLWSWVQENYSFRHLPPGRAFTLLPPWLSADWSSSDSEYISFSLQAFNKDFVSLITTRIERLTAKVLNYEANFLCLVGTYWLTRFNLLKCKPPSHTINILTIKVLTSSHASLFKY